MTVQRSKRQSLIALILITKSISKNLLIRRMQEPKNHIFGNEISRGKNVILLVTNFTPPKLEQKLYRARTQPCTHHLALQRVEICQFCTQSYPTFEGKLITYWLQPVLRHKQEHLRRYEIYRNKALTSKPIMCWIWISMSFGQYIGHTTRHLRLRIEEHRCSAIGKHILKK